MMFPPVLNKQDFTRRFLANEFGNRGPTWGTLNEFLQTDYFGLVHIRNRIAGGETWYNVLDCLVEPTYWKIVLPSGLKPEQVYFAGMCPTEKTTIQGEVFRSHRGLELFYSTVKKPMRDALKESAHSVSGVIVNSLLQYHMCPQSYSWLETLLDRYEDHVIEFSTFDCEWGVLPNYNSVWWEVRKY